MNGFKSLHATSLVMTAGCIGFRFGIRRTLSPSGLLGRMALGAGKPAEGSDRRLWPPVLRRVVGCVAALAVAWTASEALPAPGASSGEPLGIPAPSDLEFARLLLGAGRLEHALAFLKQAEPADEQERLERHLLLGRVHMALGNPEEAAENFEAILAVRPEMTPIRLEAGRANFLAGRDRRAKRHFRRAAKAGLPEHVEAAVTRFLAEINRRKPWSATLSASLLPETNAVRRTDRETVEIGGIPFRLNEDARESSGIGIRIGLGGTLTPVLSDSTRGHLSLSVAGKLYENSALNDVSATGRIGLTRLRERGPVSGGLQVGRRWAGGDGFRRRAGIWARAETRWSERVRTGFETEFEYRKHDDAPDRDGRRAALAPSVRIALTERDLLVVDAGLERADARAAHHATLTASLSATVARTFGNGLSASGSVSMRWQEHGGPDPLFEKTRKDRTLGIGGRLHFGAWQVAGFSPYLGYSYERNMSNLELHGYRNHSVDIGVSRAF